MNSNSRYIKSNDDPFFSKTHCDRCKSPLTTRIMSWFTAETICMECSSKETKLKAELRDAGDARSYEGCGYLPRI
jgi:hypothetical protein